MAEQKIRPMYGQAEFFDARTVENANEMQLAIDNLYSPRMVETRKKYIQYTIKTEDKLSKLNYRHNLTIYQIYIIHNRS